MIKKEKIVITIALVASCITATPVAAKNVEDNTYQICRNDIFIDWYQLNCKKIISEIKDDGCYIAVNLGDWLKEQDIYDISVTEDNESEGYKKCIMKEIQKKRKRMSFMIQMTLLIFLLKGWCTREMLSVIQILLLKL